VGGSAATHPGGARRDVLDTEAVLGEASAMAENPYAIPVEEFVARARVPVVDQAELRPELQQPPADWSTGVASYGDGDGGDADGE
jgi:hypothetical protein